MRWLLLLLLAPACSGTVSGGPPTDGDGPGGGAELGGADGRAPHPDLAPDRGPQIILLTGFGPFSGFPVNPSWESIKPLEGTKVAGFEVRAVQLPVEWDAAPKLLAAALQQYRPGIVISAGVAGGVARMRLETTARNLEVGTDNLGVSRNGTPCVAGGPATYATRLPLGRIASALASSIGAEISDDAGTYVCNQIFYHLMHQLDAGSTMAGFIHTPSTSATLDLAQITAAWKQVLQVVTSAAEVRGPAEPWPVTIHTPPSYEP